MTDGQKIMAMAVSGFGCIALALVGVVYKSQVLIDMAYSFGGIFGLLIGSPVFGRIRAAIKKIL